VARKAFLVPRQRQTATASADSAGGLYGNGERQQPLKPEIVHDNLKKLQ
jgi:hypothetical protein